SMCERNPRFRCTRGGAAWTGSQVAIQVSGELRRVSRRAITRGGYVNTDVLEGKWKQMRGQMKEWWGKLSDDDLDVIAGKREKLIGTLQEKYGWARRDAENEVARRLHDIDEQTRSRESGSRP